MDRLLSAIKKEFLYLIRDIPGLLVLFIMPLLLVLVVTLAQDTATGGGKRTSLLVIDNAGTDLSRAIISDLDSSAMFSVTVYTGYTFNKHNQDQGLPFTCTQMIQLFPCSWIRLLTAHTGVRSQQRSILSSGVRRQNRPWKVR